MTFSNECNCYGNGFERAVFRGFYGADSFSYILTLVPALQLLTLI